MKSLVPLSTDDTVNNFFVTYFAFLLLLFRRWPILREGSNGEPSAESVPLPESHGQDCVAVRMWGLCHGCISEVISEREEIYDVSAIRGYGLLSETSNQLSGKQLSCLINEECM